jgi:23S rRNA pseudouridine2605 synthase
VRVLGDLSDAARSQLLEGVEVEGQKAAFKSIEDGGGAGVNHWWRVTIAEGRNREVRKLFDTVGLTVSRLIRIRYGSVVLPRGLKRGVWVELDDNDVRLIRQLAGNDDRRAGSQGGPQGQKQGRAQGAGPSQQGPQGQAPGQGQGRNKNRRQGGGAPQFGQGGGGQGGFNQGNQGNQQQGPQGRRGPNGPGQGQGQGPGAGPGAQRGPKVPRAPRDESNPDSDEPMFIPNPLEQTFDRRFATGSKRISSGFGRPSDDVFGADQRPKKGGPREPDPMQTSVGYIGADAYFRKPGGGGGGGNSGGGGGGNSGGGQRRRGRR